MEVKPKMVKMATHRQEIEGFLYEPPATCYYCERDLRAKEWPEGGMGPYLMIRLPIPGVALYQCLKCGAVMGNIHAAGNMKILKSMRDVPQILRPEGKLIKLSS